MIMDIIMKYRKICVVGFHLFIVAMANVLAFVLISGGWPPSPYESMIISTIPLVIAIRLGVFHFFDLHKGLWRYVSVGDLVQIIKAVVVSTALMCAVIYPVMGYSNYPLSVLLIDTILVIMAMGGTRVSIRLWRERHHPMQEDRKGIFIYGAGDAGELLLRDMLKNPDYPYEVLGFIDDDPRKKGLRIHSISVLGTGRELGKLIAEHNPEEIIIAIPSARPQQIQRIINTCKRHNISLKTLPSLRDLISGKVLVNQIRDISIEDLLFREPVRIDPASVRGLIQGRRVFVTGAAGSIGSELCRQIMAYGPEHLILYDRNENGLFYLERELREIYPHGQFTPVIGDICDVNRLYLKFNKYRPEIVFHAAAYKHVPLMEDNVTESVKNNVFGTWNVVELSDQFGVDTFVQISTDKAVNPTSIMGSSKRIAEMAVRYMNDKSNTRFVVVRFGNVLGSSGSVVPIFKEQIQKGGPVTVTHPDIQRYFMTIPEAVQLVLQAASMGQGGEVFVLDMGEQIKIVDLARNMITLYGLVPERDIKIVYTGLRPGEKLYEELFDEQERVLPTSHPKIKMAVSVTNGQDAEKFFRKFIDLQINTLGGDQNEIIGIIKDLIPTYQGAPAKVGK